MERPHPSTEPGPRGDDSWLWSLVSAGLFLYVGFGLGLVGISDSALYNGSVTALVWGSRVVGIGLLVTLVLRRLRLPFAAPLDFALAALAAGGCLAIGAVWLAFHDGQGFLLLLFGLLNVGAARSAWHAWRLSRAASVGSGDPLDPP